MSRRPRKPTDTRSTENPRAWLAPALLAAGQVAALLAIEAQWFVFGSHSGRWVYPYIAKSGAVDLMAAASLALIVTVSAWLALKTVESHEALTVVGAFIGLTVVCVVLLNGSPNTLASLVQSDVVNGFYSAARDVDVTRLLSAFDTTVQQYAPHVRTNLPGEGAVLCASAPDLRAT